MNKHRHNEAKSFWSTSSGIACLILIASAAYFILTEHRAHFLEWLPYILLLLCPAMHFFMHGGHGMHHNNRGHGENKRGDGDE
jgi:hypothetical protein